MRGPAFLIFKAARGSCEQLGNEERLLRRPEPAGEQRLASRVKLGTFDGGYCVQQPRHRLGSMWEGTRAATPAAAATA